MEREVRYCTTEDGVRIAYATAGSGPPVVWFMSPVQSHIQLEWDQPVIRAGHEAVVAGGATLVRFDPRGTGLSDRNVDDVSSSAFVRDLEAVVCQLQLDQFPLVAIESAAGAAIIYATLHPEKMTRLILMNPASGVASMTERGKKWLALDWEMLTETVASIAFGFGYEESRKYAAFQRAAIDQETFGRFVSESLDLPDLAKQLRVPTLVIRHTGVTWLSMEPTRALVAAIPDCRMVAIEGIYTDHPDQMGRAIAEFLAPDVSGTVASTTEPQRSLAASPEPPSLRTVLFTDLVGHTEMMQRLGDERGRDVLREHERITREVLKANGGIEVKTMGDGFMASFGSVTKAVECAIALQRAFEEWNAGVGRDVPAERLYVRVGLNAGEPIEEDGDLFGSTVILASRIAAKAEGGEILVADTVRGLCSGKGFLFADRGEFVAKGFEEPVRIFEVSWRD